jgi:transposase InsO family protein
VILAAIDAAMTAGCELARACVQAGVSARTVSRWRARPGVGDGRAGPNTEPQNALTAAERAEVLVVLNSPEFRDVSPKQIVPRLADKKIYMASESSMYRILRAEAQLAHRERSRPASPRPVSAHVARRPDQVYSWDITYLPASIRGTFFFLYLFVDIFSRKIVGWSTELAQNDELAAAIFMRSCKENDVDPHGVVLHSDNGSPMTGSTMLQTLENLGVIPSFSRPGVCDDNAYSEALFRTVKFRPGYPGKFDSLEAAREWVAAFVEWYNNEHRHSAIRYVTPAQRHEGADVALLAARHALYQRARVRHPERWTGSTRDWTRPEIAHLNSRSEGI